MTTLQLLEISSLLLEMLFFLVQMSFASFLSFHFYHPLCPYLNVLKFINILQIVKHRGKSKMAGQDRH